ncbi:uncharacterized protein LAESUDRAFT_469056 [Laetiporus sulphureus 93-53]|uniref:C2H2-type domain-containing protein n=1 Tax=Laetiporus sulphureus 93-53 TaxID=1314785 RepID=A0A165G9F9_9APHY|nr:uncharacterized protein LAESUDRAFT_469056 [Laetiporus sulphureus 93-53]KZT10021.1 hypothetical protein LAESUDRAFT_469056 [Laetiporus sulphureus 93-53]
MRDAVYDTKEPSTIDPALLSMPCGRTALSAPPATAFPSLITPASMSPPLDIPFPSEHAMGTLYMTNHVHANTYDRERAINSDATNSDEGSILFPDPSPAARYRPLTTNLPIRTRKSKTAEVTGRYECQSRNKNAEIPDELIFLALQDPSRGCPVNECAYVPTAIGKRGSGQASNLLRHIESHRSKQWVCCGLPLNVAIEKGLRQEGDLPNFYYGGQPMVGGCKHYLSRQDSLVRHLEGKGRDCLTDVLIVERINKEQRASWRELLRQYGK